MTRIELTFTKSNHNSATVLTDKECLCLFEVHFSFTFTIFGHVPAPTEIDILFQRCGDMRIEDIGRCVLKFDLGYLFNLLINPSCSNLITPPIVNLLPSTICFALTWHLHICKYFCYCIMCETKKMKFAKFHNS